MHVLTIAGSAGRLEATGGKGFNSVLMDVADIGTHMLTLFSYPELYGVADNNPYGLKVFAFLRFCGLAFRHEHILDSKAAPRGQLPYIEDDGEIIGDSDAIIAHLIRKHGLDIDDALIPEQRRMDFLIRRMLDDLYWVMSYSRWRDPRFWPLFRDEMLRTHPNLTMTGLEAAQRYNFDRYYYQGIGRFEPEQVYARGLSDLQALTESMADTGYFFGANRHSVDAGIYGFLANIHFYAIETPLKIFLSSQPNLVRYCETVHETVTR